MSRRAALPRFGLFSRAFPSTALLGTIADMSSPSRLIRTPALWVLYSLIALGEIAQKQGNKAEARKYFKEVKSKALRKDEAYKDAKRRLKNLEKGD